MVLIGVAFTLIAFVLGALVTALFWGPLFAVVGGVLSLSAGFGLGRELAGYRYSWGPISVSRLALEAFMRSYASSRGLREEDRWRFRSAHRHLPLPGVAARAAALAGLDLPADLEVERDGATVAIWQPVTGSMLFTVAGFDTFRAAAGELLASSLAQVGEHGEDATVPAVAVA